MGQLTDKELVGKFLKGLNCETGSTFHVDCHPDEVNRQSQAVDALAIDNNGSLLDIEHTLIQPFENEKDETHKLFRRIFVPLENLQGVPEFMIVLWFPVGRVPKGADYEEVAKGVRGWVESNKDSLPIGRSRQTITAIPFDLCIMVDKHRDPSGQIYVGRCSVPQNFTNVVEKALSNKLEKLAGTIADKRILLFEEDNLPHLNSQIEKSLLSLKDSFPRIGEIDEVWQAITTPLSFVWFLKVWPTADEPGFLVDL